MKIQPKMILIIMVRTSTINGIFVDRVVQFQARVVLSFDVPKSSKCFGRVSINKVYEERLENWEEGLRNPAIPRSCRDMKWWKPWPFFRSIFQPALSFLIEFLSRRLASLLFFSLFRLYAYPLWIGDFYVKVCLLTIYINVGLSIHAKFASCMIIFLFLKFSILLLFF